MHQHKVNGCVMCWRHQDYKINRQSMTRNSFKILGYLLVFFLIFSDAMSSKSVISCESLRKGNREDCNSSGMLSPNMLGLNWENSLWIKAPVEVVWSWIPCILSSNTELEDNSWSCLLPWTFFCVPLPSSWLIWLSTLSSITTGLLGIGYSINSEHSSGILEFLDRNTNSRLGTTFLSWMIRPSVR